MMNFRHLPVQHRALIKAQQSIIFLANCFVSFQFFSASFTSALSSVKLLLYIKQPLDSIRKWPYLCFHRTCPIKSVSCIRYLSIVRSKQSVSTRLGDTTSNYWTSNKNFKLLLVNSCSLHCVDFVFYINGGMQAKGIWKQDPYANILAQEECEWGVEKVPQRGNLYFIPFA